MYQIVMRLSDYMENIPYLVSIICGYLLAMATFLLVVNPMHNLVQFFVAYKCGDKVIKEKGLLKYLIFPSFNWIGAVSALVLRMGFSEPIIYKRDNFYRPVLGTALTSASGVITYLLCGVLFQIGYSVLSFLGLFGLHSPGLSAIPENGPFYLYIYIAVFTAFSFTAWICISSAILNLIPFCPLDMGELLYMNFNLRWYDAFRNNDALVSIIIFVICFVTIGKPNGLIQKFASLILDGVFNGISAIFT